MKMKKKEPRTRSVSVKLSDSESKKLEEFSKSMGISKSDILRNFTTWMDVDYRMNVNRALRNMYRLDKAGEAVKNGTIKRINFKGVIFEKPKHAHWKGLGDSWRFCCSNCASVAFDINELLTISDFRYCPYCGAKLDEVGDDDA